MFFTEEYISNRYKEGESSGFMYLIENEVEKSVYASLISLVIGFLINYGTSSRKRFDTLMKKEKDNQKFLSESKKIIISMKKKTIAFIIISLIFLAFFWYYISAFCALYQKSQIPWLESAGITLLFCYILQSFVAFLITLSRYIGLRCHISCLYTLSTYFI